MTEPKFTPGPWECIIDDTGGPQTGWPLCVIGESSEKLIVHPGGHYPYEWDVKTSLEEAVANAKLLAAAPELFHALQAFVENEDDQEYMGLYAAGKAALAKALEQ